MSTKQSPFPSRSWKFKLSMSIFALGIKLSRRSDGTINRRLMSFFDIKSAPSAQPINGVKVSDITIDPSRPLWFRLYVPTAIDGSCNNDNSQLPVIVYFHGGGFAWMSANSLLCNDLCRRLAGELPAVIVSVNYRNSPDYRYPSQVEDCFDVLRFIENNSNFEGFPKNINLNHCFIGGDSAGGNLAHHVAVNACVYEFRNLNIIGVISIQPFFGGEERTESETRLVGAPLSNLEGNDWLWKAFLPEGSDRDHPAANIFGPNSRDISGLNKFPATIVIVGGFDPINDWQKRYYEGLKKSGKEANLIVYPNAFHGFYVVPELPESSLFVKEVRKFMQEQSNKQK
ncbi:hypothetical protein Q3G72_024784 [Acer saccharum]|nr:hypothetical protein Q3G72_024784 [Acer saccharum]